MYMYMYTCTCIILIHVHVQYRPDLTSWVHAGSMQGLASEF